MNENEFLSLLNEIGFPERYWLLCNQFAVNPSIIGKSGKKQDILSAFTEVGIVPEIPEAGAYVCERETIAGIEWSGTFCKQRNGLELMIDGVASDYVLGSNFAVLAYDAKQLADSSFKLDRFKGPSPYPRPDHNGDSEAMRAIIKEFVTLLRSIKSAIHKRCDGE